jgi:hypothetical protein
MAGAPPPDGMLVGAPVVGTISASGGVGVGEGEGVLVGKGVGVGVAANRATAAPPRELEISPPTTSTLTA